MPKSVVVRLRRRWIFCVSLLCGLCGASGAPAASLSHGTDPLFRDGMEGPAAGPFTDAEAARFLTQATFGPTDADIAHLRAIGYQAWLNEQFAAAPTLEMSYYNWISGLGEDIGQGNRQEAWFLGALGGPDPQNNTVIHKDQLRQRVAFALSEIFVVSEQNPTLSEFTPGLFYYYDILVQNAFGNYRQLLEAVTLSPAMGVYLNMMGNQRADSSQNLHPDENYAREINQLFSIGLVMLNPDGTPQLSNGQPIPTYTQSTITSFAQVFTGWSWYDCDEDTNPGAFPYCGPDYGGTGNPPFADNFLHPMKAFASFHDNSTHPDDATSKHLLSYPGVFHSGIVLNGQTPEADLAFALDNIFNHPNVGPFIGKQLIQRLVTSNPSPAYVQRVASVFNNNGSGVRGDLKAVVSAILLDPEARYDRYRNADSYGKLREPLLALTHYWRGMDAVHTCGQTNSNPGQGQSPYFYDNAYRYAGGSTAWVVGYNTSYGVGVGQASLDALTVFNFFKPSFLPPGEMTTRGLLGPEFQINTDSVIADTTNTVTGNTYYGSFDISDTCDPNDTVGDVRVNHAKDLALAGSAQGGTGDPADRLVDAYNKRFMSGQMSPYMRNQLLTALNPISQSNSGGDDFRLVRIRNALFLILSSPEYMVQK